MIHLSNTSNGGDAVNELSEDQLVKLRSRLEERRTRLRAELQDEKSVAVPVESDSQDSELSYVAGQDQKVDAQLNERHTLELRDIEDALQRMDAGHYGICQDCGDSIDVKRLTAYPAARRCIDCKQAFEQESGITRHS
jgi:RNA polymerase-binding protein DksA